MLVLVSVSETLLTLFTVEMRCARALGGPVRNGGSKTSAMNRLTAITPQIAALFLMPVLV
jgi:hypothetical protein